MAAHVEPPVVEVTATVVDPNFVLSSVEVAVMVTVSGGVPAGVNVTPVPEATPVDVLKEPSAVGEIVRFTVLVNAPVPVTVGVQVAVCVEDIDDGVHETVTAVIAGGAVVTVIFAEPKIFRKPTAAE
jgi:hypothetical protein